MTKRHTPFPVKRYAYYGRRGHFERKRHRPYRKKKTYTSTTKRKPHRIKYLSLLDRINK